MTPPLVGFTIKGDVVGANQAYPIEVEERDTYFHVPVKTVFALQTPKLLPLDCSSVKRGVLSS